MILVIVLLVLWLVLSVIAFAINGLVWLGIIGVALFLGTSAIGFVPRRTVRRSTPS